MAGLLALAALALAACKPKAELMGDLDAGDGAASGEAASVAENAVANAARPDSDRALDDKRKPAAVLDFAGVEPGMRVFEMEAGEGYYTELLSFIVGESGEVVMHNPAAFDGFLGDAVETRLADDRLANVRHSKTNFDALTAEDSSMDIVTWMLGPHELYFTPASGESLGDVEGAYAEAFRIVKPRGAFIILDHAAAPGASSETGGTVHRIDPAIVKGLAEAAGFMLVDESDILRNPDDDYEMSVFDPAVRRKTDRFLLKYKKPG